MRSWTSDSGGRHLGGIAATHVYSLVDDLGQDFFTAGGSAGNALVVVWDGM